MTKFQVSPADDNGIDRQSSRTSHGENDDTQVETVDLQPDPRAANDTVVDGEGPTVTGGHAEDTNVGPASTEDLQDDTDKNLYLFEEDMKQMPRVSTFLQTIASYHTTIPNVKDVENSKKQPKKAKLGVVLGVYLPTIQHIFGVLMFVRLAWIVGSMGTLQAFAMVFLCCLTTFVTSISMSAIATNGVVQAGGSYFMISRNLGPECGGAVGICFYLANTFAVDLYILGSIEILLQYMAPGISFFGDIHKDPWNNFRVYGTVTLIVLTILVAVGVRFVQMFAPFSLACVIVSILCVYIGSFEASAKTRDVWICVLGERLLGLPSNDTLHALDWCNKDPAGDIWHRYCDDAGACDDYFLNNNISYKPGIPGIASGVIKENLFSYYLKQDEVTPGVKGDHHKGEVIADMTTTFVALCAIYFPSVTGIMTGSNMSGDLRDPQQSIPVGTIAAQLTCSFVYLCFVVFFGATTEAVLLRDKFGESLGGSLLVAQLAWPNQWVLLVGAFCSTIGAALQCLTSAPRLLQAIARDDIIPFLRIFRVTTKNGEPIRALLITFLISELGIIVASLDYVAPVIDVCFLMCYMFVNVICVLQTLLKSPHWRPRYKYYHWSLSLLGVILNLALSIIAGWYYALAAFAMAAFVYKYVEYKGGEKEWGDGIQGLSMSAAQQALLKLEEGDPHTKNWRPQLLVLCKMTSELRPKYPQLVSLASQLKAGKGLTVVAAVMEGSYADKADQVKEAKQTLKELMDEEKVKGFAKVMVTKDMTEGLNIFVQTVGLGGLRHNAVLVGWPYGWRESHEERSWQVFIDTVRAVTAKELALLVPRNITNFPHNKMRLSSTIDVWWIVHDGGMLILLSFLLKQHKVWRSCKLRIFTVAQITDNSIQLKKDLEQFLYQLRIDAEVHVEEMYDSDISPYTVERTLDMEKRSQMIRELKLMKRRPTKPKLSGVISIQEIVDASHQPRSQSNLHTPSTDALGDNSPSTPQPVPSVTISMDDDRPAGSDSGAEDRSTTNNGDTLNADGEKMVHFTFSASDGKAFIESASHKKDGLLKPEGGVSVAEGKLMRMHTAVRLNESIRNQSGQADLVILNFPAPPARLSAEENYMEYLEALTEGLDRVLMVRGSGREVVTIYS